MRTILQLAAALLLTGAATTHAQITNPDALVAPPPRNPARSTPKATDDLQWLWQYTQPSPVGSKTALLADPRFAALLADNFKAPQSMWGQGVPLSDAARIFLGGAGAVAPSGGGVSANRFLAVTGCVASQCQQRGLLYADLGERDPLLVFAALRWSEQSQTVDQPNAPYTLWLFPSRTLETEHLPQSLRDLLHDWLWLQPSACLPYHITHAILVDPNGAPHILGSLEAGITPAPCKPPSGLNQ